MCREIINLLGVGGKTGKKKKRVRGFDAGCVGGRKIQITKHKSTDQKKRPT